MRKVTSGVFCVILVLLLWASGAVASPFHQHKGMSLALESNSPFHQHEKMGSALESKNGQQVCLLEHHQKGIPCPHKKNPKMGKGLIIGTDCGGKPFGSVPISVDFSKNLFVDLNISLLSLNENLGNFVLFSSAYIFSHSLQIDHPPKFL